MLLAMPLATPLAMPNTKVQFANRARWLPSPFARIRPRFAKVEGLGLKRVTRAVGHLAPE